MTYQAIYERAEDGSIWGYTPDVPGAFGAGDTLDEAKASLREGIRLWIELAREKGEEIPASSTISSSAIAIELLDVPAA
jgi:predicted RNase H-like HicB family nuclease